MIFYKSVRFTARLRFLNLKSIFCFYSILLSTVSPLRYVQYLPSLYSASAESSVSLNLICLFLSHFRIELGGFTKTAICQGHRLHFAICCKIKLGEVVYPSLFGLRLPSKTFPFTSGLRCRDCVRDGGGVKGEITWMTTNVEMCVRTLRTWWWSSWHLIVPF